MSNQQPLVLQVELGPQFTLLVENKESTNETLTLEVGVKSSSLFGGVIGGGSFYDVPDEIDDSDPIYFYFGWINQNAGWLVHRQIRTSSLTSQALIANNGTVPDLATAWPLRATLTYSS